MFFRGSWLVPRLIPGQSNKHRVWLSSFVYEIRFFRFLLAFVSPVVYWLNRYAGGSQNSLWRHVCKQKFSVRSQLYIWFWFWLLGIACFRWVRSGHCRFDLAVERSLGKKFEIFGSDKVAVPSFFCLRNSLPCQKVAIFSFDFFSRLHWYTRYAKTKFLKNYILWFNFLTKLTLTLFILFEMGNSLDIWNHQLVHEQMGCFGANH